jgi:isopenicillin-N N-acyltransferase-like protein
MVGKIGVNASGFAMCVNLLNFTRIPASLPCPCAHFLRRVLEEAHSVEEAIALIGSAKRQPLAIT